MGRIQTHILVSQGALRHFDKKNLALDVKTSFPHVDCPRQLESTGAFNFRDR